MSAPSLVIGVDAGGTATRVRITRDGTTVAEAEGRAGTVRAGQAMASALAITETVRTALVRGGLVTATADVLVAGVAGAGRPAEREALEAALRAERLATRLVVTTDIALAHAAAFDGTAGLLLIAGTGSIVLARNAAGQEYRVGGWGWQVGDEGAGAWIGREAVRRVLQMRDGRRPASAGFADAVRRAARTPDDDALVRWGNAASAAELGAVAPAVLAAAEAGDEQGRTLRDEAVAHLAALVRAADAAAGALPIALAGGLCAHEGFRAALAAAIGPERVRAGRADALAGALRLARADG